MGTGWILLVFSLACVPSAQAPAPHDGRSDVSAKPIALPDSPRTTKPPVVSEKETAPVRVAYLEHVGPYWGLSSIVAEVQHAMTELKEAGPLFIRFFGDPRAAGTSERRMHVGFVLQGSRDPGPPFHADRWPQGRVAYVLLEGSFGATSQHYAALFDWAKAAGYETGSTLTELFWVAEGKGGREVVELQLALGPRHPLPAAAAESATAETAPQATTTIASATKGETGSDEAEMPAGTPRIVQEDEIVASQAEATNDRAEQPASPARASVPEVSNVSAVEKVLLDAEPEAVADFLLGGWNNLDREDRVWLSQIVSRLGALEHALDRREHPDSIERLRQTLAAISRRRGELANIQSDGRMNPPAVEIALRSNPRRALLHDIDRFLAQVGNGSMPMEQLPGACFRFIAQAQHLLRSADLK